MQISKTSFGKTAEGYEAFLFTLKNDNNSVVKITNFGGIIVSIIVPDKNGIFADVVLGYDNVLKYQNSIEYFGAIIGRNSNRISNAHFKLNGNEYSLFKNNGNNNLHSGEKGFDKQLWDYKVLDNSLVLSYYSKDGESGFPGNLKVSVVYTLTDNDEVEIEYTAFSDADTIVNLTNHSYFNLLGHSGGSILNHSLKISADSFTEINAECIPTGSIKPGDGTPFDFRDLQNIGNRIEKDDINLINGLGYDHNFVLNGSGLRMVAELFEEKSGRCMQVITDMPGIQFYSGNFLDGTAIGKEGAVYNKRNGLCLETQYFPDAINQDNFESPV